MKASIAIIGFAIAWFYLPPLLAAETIHTWIDKDGTKRFSNDPPPAGAKHYEQLQALPKDEAEQNNTQERRQSYDTMIEKAKREAERNKWQRSTKKAQKKRVAEMEMQIKINAEREQLKRQLEKAEKMKLGSSSHRRRRRMKIDKIQKQLEQLNKSPQAYFNNKTSQDAGTTDAQSSY